MWDSRAARPSVARAARPAGPGAEDVSEAALDGVACTPRGRAWPERPGPQGQERKT